MTYCANLTLWRNGYETDCDLRCLKTSASCTGAGCIKALNNKTGVFEQYGDEELELIACFTCNGCCSETIGDNEKMQKKIKRIKMLAPDFVHLSNCCKKKDENGEKLLCPVIKKFAAEFTASGITVIEGIH